MGKVEMSMRAVEMQGTTPQPKPRHVCLGTPHALSSITLQSSTTYAHHFHHMPAGIWEGQTEASLPLTVRPR